MIESVAWKEGEPNVLVITWNTDAGKTATEVDMSKFIDTYTSGDEELLTVEGYVITPVTGEIKENETGLAVAGDVWAAVNAEEERATGVEEGLDERIEALEALKVSATGDDFVSASANGYAVTVGATEELSDAVAKI